MFIFFYLRSSAFIGGFNNHMAHIYIGTSGWNYDSWRDDFYRGIPRKNWLRFCAGRFTGIEVNATFYRLQSKETFRRWRDETPANFRFAIKGNRFLTHNKKLADPLPAIRLERDRAKGLGGKLAAVVWQLPQPFRKNMDRLHIFARALKSWPQARHAIEFRHDSWFDDEVAACLRAHRLAVCQSDASDWPLWDAVTTDMVYVRLHGHDVTYASFYSDKELARWARRVRRWIREGRDVHVYFDNDAFGAAPLNALQLIRLVNEKSVKPQVNADNFAGSENWTAEHSDAGPSASEGERQGRREHKRR